MPENLAPVYWLFLTLSGVALIRLRRRRREVNRPYRVPFYPLVPLAFPLGSGYVVIASLRYVGWTGSLLSLGVLALGLLAGFGLAKLIGSPANRGVAT
ncbi:hypothetical protein ACLB0R_03980 [Sphingomonas sp. GlSt437]|uniref:hypothetical protein n=1 Tax=Sphingomonas sp. GlSt437 TaxID=3389970 RepID=UPI003A8C5356